MTLGLSAGPAGAQPTCNDTWTNTAGGPWNTPADWSTGAVPTAKQDVCITTPGKYVVTLTGPEQAHSITVGTGTTGTQTLLVQGTDAADATLTVATASFIQTGGELELEGTTGTTGTATITSPAGATVPLLTNQGTLLTTGSEEDSLDLNLENEGTFTVAGLSAAQANETTTTNDGLLSIDSGDEFDVTDSTLTNDGSVANAGVLSLDDSTWTQSVDVSGAKQTGNAVLLTDNSFLSDSTGAGQFELLDSDGLDGTIAAGQTVTVIGTDDNSGAAEMGSDGVTNDGTLILDSEGGSATLGNQDDPETFTNDGTFETEQQTGTNQDDVLNSTFDNTTSGKVVVASGELDQGDETTTTNDGTITVDAGATYAVTTEDVLVNEDDGTLAFQIASATSFGTMDFSSGGVFDLDGGTASPILTDGYAPPVGTEFDVILADSSGDFGTVTNNFNADYEDTFIGLVRDTDNTVATITASPNPTTYGTTVTLTATITPGPGGVGNPGGTVNFDDDRTLLGTATPSTTNGVTTAKLTISTLAATSHSITATYSGNANYGGYISDPVTVTVTKAATTTTLKSSANPATFGQAVTFTATVTGPSGGAAPSGSVSFSDGSTSLGTGTLSTTGGVTTATLTLSTLSVATHSITASYGGNTNELSSTTTSPLSQVVKTATPTVTVSPSSGSITYGQTVSFTATVTGPSGASAPTGTVNFTDSGSALGTATLSTTAGVTTAKLTVSPAGGSHSVTATYTGNTNYATGTSSTPAAVTVNKAATTTTLKSSANPATFGQAVTFTATVTGPTGASPPTGGVSFSDGSTSLGTGTLSTTGGVTTATLTLSTLSVATHSIIASYGGNTNELSSTTTSPLSQVVKTATPTVTISPSSGSITYGQTVTFTATVTGPSSASAPTGSVNFTDGSTALGSATLVTTAGVTTAKLTLTLPAGSHSVTATYTGNTDYATAASTRAAAVTVTQAATTTTLKSSANPSTFGEAVTFTATVTGPSGGAAPTGSVSFKDGTSSLGTGTLSTTAGVTTATLTVSTLSIATHSITATYAGDANELSSTTPTPLSQVVKTTATVSLSSGPATSGQPVTFTATVTGPTGAPAPTGTVTFDDGSTQLGTVSLTPTAGVPTAKLTVPTLTAGSHSITAHYSGDPNFQSGATPTPLVAVVTAPITTAITTTTTTASVASKPITSTSISTSATSASTTTSTTTSSTTTSSNNVPPPPPVLGKDENVALVSGKVFIELPGGAASVKGPLAVESLSKGTHFIPLTQARQIPVGSILNTVGGTVAITAATSKKGQYYTGDFTAGVFELLQARSQKGLSDIDLMDTLNRKKTCTSIGKQASAARSVSSKVLGLLKSTDHGKFTTRGDYSAATTRGTAYSVENTCAGTTTAVTRGSVVVDYFRRHKNVVVSAGHAFTAKASGGPSSVFSIGKQK